MSLFSTIVSKIESWFDTSPVGEMIEADAKLALAELEKVSAADLENVVKLIGTTILSNLVTGGAGSQAAVISAIEAGIAAAVPAFKAAGADISTKTVSTLVTTVVNQMSSQVDAVTSRAA